MDLGNWFEHIEAAITVCDRDGIILGMNEQAGRVFAKDGGRALRGKNLFDCHPENAKKKIKDILDTQRSNVYTTEKEGRKKLIYQAPWFENGECAGLVEFSIPLPEQMPHLLRH